MSNVITPKGYSALQARKACLYIEAIITALNAAVNALEQGEGHEYSQTFLLRTSVGALLSAGEEAIADLESNTQDRAATIQAYRNQIKEIRKRVSEANPK